ncbi:MAG: RNA polymerase sigma factor [Gemmatimonadota bacterium]|nr:MAG: RNA polymerase sigma factor [Gemmatimonadota bacterium]
MSGPARRDDSDQALIRGAQAGEGAAFEDLVRRYYGQIYRWAVARTGDRDEAEDVTQETLLRLHRHLPSFDGRSRFSTWLYQVTRSAAADLHRKRARRERLALRVKRHTPVAVDPRGDEVVTDERRASDLVKTFLEELSERQREVFDLVDLQGFSTVDVSEMLRMEPVTVRSHLFRARKAIRKKILAARPELVEGYGQQV